jgi:hypothetical protein
MNRYIIIILIIIISPYKPFYAFFNLGARWGGWICHAPAALSPGKNLVPFV